MNELIARLRGNAGVADCLDAADALERCLREDAIKANANKLLMDQVERQQKKIEELERELDGERKAANHWIKEANQEHNDAIRLAERAEKAESSLRECMAHADAMAKSWNDYANADHANEDDAGADHAQDVETYREWRAKQ